MTRLPAWAVVLVLSVGCAHPRGADPSAVPPRHQLLPRIDHHQHLVGPTVIEPPPESLPQIALPPELAAIVLQRERISGSKDPSEVYTDDALILDVGSGEDHWVRGKAAGEQMASLHSPGTRLLPNAYAMDGATAWVAGTIRTGTSTLDEMHFVLGLRKVAPGQWKVALEYATNKPPPAFTEPILADTLIEHLDDAGIERAVVLSVAYWLGSPLGGRVVEDEAAKVAAENDWLIGQAARFPQRLVPFCSANPLKDYAIAELERCAKLPAVKGMKLHFGNSGVDVKNPEHVAKVRAFFEAANRRRLAIVVHLWTLDPGYGREHSKIFLEQLLPAAPDVVVQIGHMAGAGRYAHDDAMEVFADAITAKDPRMARVYFDLTTVVPEEQSPEKNALVAKRIRQVGLDRVLFGNDTLLPTRPGPLQAWSLIRRKLPLTDAELATIAGNVAPYLR